MICPYCIFQALILLIVANGAPVVADRLLKRRFDLAVDFGIHLADDRPLFGKSKTWRGLLAAALMAALAAVIFDIAPLSGMFFGLLAMLGDLVSSFIKRRKGLRESSRAKVLDTLPEALLPTFFFHETLGLGGLDIILVACLFLLVDQYLSPLLYQWHIRKRPY
jgi:CDP-2,3-bis-(O-geranylgeranyl)-sn-glycerol synthase